jgi:uncharacterized protein (DUF305 family)
VLTDDHPAVDEHVPEPRRSIGPARWQVVVLVIALCFLAGVVGWWLNQADDPAFNAVDTGFLADMETHHNSAINMSFDYLDRSHDPVVKHFAQEIISSQSQELAVMNSYLNSSGVDLTDDRVAMAWMGHPVAPADMPGMPTKAQLAALDASQGLEADDVFTHLMIDHHAGGIGMAEYAAAHGEHTGVRNFARAMAKVQRSEIAEINTRRVQLGLPAIPQSEITGLERIHSEPSPSE